MRFGQTNEIANSKRRFDRIGPELNLAQSALVSGIGTDFMFFSTSGRNGLIIWCCLDSNAKFSVKYQSLTVRPVQNCSLCFELLGRE